MSGGLLTALLYGVAHVRRPEPDRGTLMAFGDYQIELYLGALDGYPTLADLTPDTLRRTPR